MSNDTLPETVESLYRLLNSIDIDLDFHPSPYKKPGFLKEEAMEFLVPIGKNKAGCCICFWNQQSLHDLSDSPVAWLDSEGEPMEVFAQNAIEFINLIWYGTGFIYDVLTAKMRFKESPLIFPNPLDIFKEQDMKVQLENRITPLKKFAIFNELKDKYFSEINLHPVKIILRANEKYSSFPTLIQPYIL